VVIGSQVIWVNTAELDRIAEIVRSFDKQVRTQIVAQLHEVWQRRPTAWPAVSLQDLGVTRRVGP
jgi:hypothetical protein